MSQRHQGLAMNRARAQSLAQHFLGIFKAPERAEILGHLAQHRGSVLRGSRRRLPRRRLHCASYLRVILLRCSDRRGQPRLLKAGSCCMHAASAWSMSISFRILLAAGPRVVFRLRRCMLCTRASRPLL